MPVPRKRWAANLALTKVSSFTNECKCFAFRYAPILYRIIHLHAMKRKTFLLTLALFTTLAFTLNGQSYKLTNADFSITGTSNLHDWESQVSKVNWRGEFILSEGGVEAIRNVAISIPVTGIISSKGRIMDKKTHTALQAEAFPNITYSLTSSTITKNGNRMIANTKGSLTVTGTTRTVSIPVQIEQLANGQIRASGNYTLKMTDYGIEPPTALLGSLTTGDEVSLHFKLSFSPQ